jgi:hypothetical protein
MRRRDKKDTFNESVPLGRRYNEPILKCEKPGLRQWDDQGYMTIRSKNNEQTILHFT